VVRGKNNTTGLALVKVYDLNRGASSKLCNISRRAFVSTGSDIVIAGFVLGNQRVTRRVMTDHHPRTGSEFERVWLVARPGQSELELRDENGTLLVSKTIGRITQLKRQRSPRQNWRRATRKSQP
jgi:hypothetical protein